MCAAIAASSSSPAISIPTKLRFEFDDSTGKETESKINPVTANAVTCPGKQLRRDQLPHRQRVEACAKQIAVEPETGLWSEHDCLKPPIADKTGSHH